MWMGVLLLVLMVVGIVGLAAMHRVSVLATAWWYVRAMSLTLVCVAGPLFSIVMAAAFAFVVANKLYDGLGLGLLLPIALAALVAWKEFKEKWYPKIESWLEKVIGPAPGERRFQMKEMLEAARSGEAWLERADPEASGAHPSGAQGSTLGPGRPRLPAGLDSPAASTD